MAGNDARAASGLRARYAHALALQAFVYTYPLYEMARLRVATSPRRNPRGEPAGDAPESPLRWLNALVHARKLLGAGASRVVTPNNDTLYSTAWLDLTRGPLLFTVPDTADRYYVAGLLDFHTNPFAHIGRRTTGTRAGRFLLAGPAWQGEVPGGVTLVRSPTPHAWMIMRIMVDSPADVPAVNRLQDGFDLRPFAAVVPGRDDPAHRGAGEAGVRDGTGHDGPARGLPWNGERVDTWFDLCTPFSPRHFVATVNRALAENPPPPGHAALVAQFARVGIGAGLDPYDGSHDAGVVAALERAIEAGARDLGEDEGRGAKGWRAAAIIGESFGDDFLLRAEVARRYIGALASAEAIYPMAHTDRDGEPLSGAHRYQLRFAPGGEPPVDAYWSLTIYDDATCMLVPNDAERHRVGDRSVDLVRDADGGLALLIQRTSPGVALEPNWLPAPAGRFYLVLRAYQPRSEMLDGRYRLPEIERID